MNVSRSRRRLVWLAALGVALVGSLVFVAMLAPDTNGSGEPVLRPEASGFDTTGDTAAASTGATGEGSGVSFGGMSATSLIVRLGLVALIIGGSIVALRWFAKRTAGPRSTTGYLRVVDTLAISNGRSIHLVALGERMIAVGATAQQLTLLNELTEDEAADVRARLPRAGDQPLASFASELFQAMRTGGRTPRGHQAAIGEEVR